MARFRRTRAWLTGYADGVANAQIAAQYRNNTEYMNGYRAGRAARS